MNLLTLGDYFKVRYGRRVELVASIFLAPPYIGYIAAQLVAMGLILNVVTGLDLWQGVVISAVVVTAYTFVGGMWAISITDFFQSIIIIIGLLVLAFILSDEAGGVGEVLAGVKGEHLKFLPSFEFKEIVLYIAAWSVLDLVQFHRKTYFNVRCHLAQRALQNGHVTSLRCYISLLRCCHCTSAFARAIFIRSKSVRILNSVYPTWCSLIHQCLCKFFSLVHYSQRS